jgi:trans-aconitate 2-methyltransferase
VEDVLPRTRGPGPSHGWRNRFRIGGVARCGHNSLCLVNVRDFYDNYTEHQVDVGVNDRHRAIHDWLKRFGLRRGLAVLEIGCGIGTETELIAESIGSSGSLLAVDLSPASVEVARKRLSDRRNVEFVAADVIELTLDRRFDVIVLPDVIEHIPLAEHSRLFANVRRWLNDSGWVLIHMPNPLYLEWCRLHRPELLQVVDQPIFTEVLLANAVPHGLYLHYLETYSIWIEENDYQVAVLKPRPAELQFHIKEAHRFSVHGVSASLRWVADVVARRRTRA